MLRQFVIDTLIARVVASHGEITRRYIDHLSGRGIAFTVERDCATRATLRSTRSATSVHI
jgi:hypothetical protein